MRATRWLPPLPGIWPSVVSGRASNVSFVASRMSQAMASSKPTPMAYFSMAQTTGLGQRSGAAMFQERCDIPSRSICGNALTSPPDV